MRSPVRPAGATLWCSTRNCPALACASPLPAPRPSCTSTGSGPKVRRLVLGEYGTLTPAQARTLAERARAQARAGGDPVADRRDKARATVAAEAEARRRAEADALTFGRLAELWVAGGLRDRRDSYRR